MRILGLLALFIDLSLGYDFFLADLQKSFGFEELLLIGLPADL